MLGRLGLTVDECIEQYSTLIEQVFKKKIHRLPINLKFKVNPRFSSDVLQKAIEGVLSERELRADTPLLEESPSSPCKVFVLDIILASRRLDTNACLQICLCNS